MSTNLVGLLSLYGSCYSRDFHYQYSRHNFKTQKNISNTQLNDPGSQLGTLRSKVSVQC